MGAERRPLAEVGAPALLRALRDRPPPPARPAASLGPQQYDESGFPIPQRVESFAERIRRLLAS